jgi:hypothetical protein
MDSGKGSEIHSGEIQVTLPSGEVRSASVLWEDPDSVGEKPPLFDGPEDELRNVEDLLRTFVAAQAEEGLSDLDRFQLERRVTELRTERDRLRAEIAGE